MRLPLSSTETSTDDAQLQGKIFLDIDNSEVKASPDSHEPRHTFGLLRGRAKMNENGAGMIRLTHFEVTGLFGEFDHQIPLNEKERVTALIGPNGLGKTACLRLINALFRRQWSTLAATEFARVRYCFSDGSTVEVSHQANTDSETEVSDAVGLTFLTMAPDVSESESWTPRMADEMPGRLARIEGYLPYITRTGPRSWMHDVTRQSYTLQELVEAFGDILPDHIISSLSSSPPPILNRIIKQIDCHLIETQRLLVFQPDDSRRNPASASTLAISRKAQTLKTIVARELANYAAISQSLDRSFPRRVLQLGPIKPSDDITSSLSELEELRNGLTEAGILEQEAEDTLPQINQIDSAVAAVLNVYVDDTRKKLDVLAQLRSRILLFIELIDNRFAPKSVIVEKSVGFIVKRSTEVTVPLEKLSSGEQHQLVLFFELLFELRENALILIDEPELSLHISWQKKFITDLKRIISLNGFDVVLATHSPQLIGEWEGLVVELGEVDPL